jgi:hypothetical protein
MASVAEAENLILPKESVSSTGGNTAAYETAYTGGSKKKASKKTGKRRIKKGILSSLKRIFTWRKTAKRTRK